MHKLRLKSQCFILELVWIMRHLRCLDKNQVAWLWIQLIKKRIIISAKCSNIALCGVDLILLETADRIFFRSLRHFPPVWVTSVELALAIAAVGDYDDNLMDEYQQTHKQNYQTVYKIPFLTTLQMPTFDHGVFK